MNAVKIGKKNQFYVALLISVVIIASSWLLARDIKTNGVWEWLLSSFCLFFLLPIIVIKTYFKKNLSDFHLSFDFKAKEVLLSVIAGGIFIGLFSLLVIKLGWYEEFPVSNVLLGGKGVFLFVYLVVFPLVIFFENFFFLGFLLRSAERALGAWKGFLIFLIFTSIFYFIREEFSLVVFSLTLLVNIFLGWLVLKTRTIILASIISFLISMVVDFTILYQINLIK